MGPRLVILLVLALGLAVYVATKAAAPRKVNVIEGGDGEPVDPTPAGPTIREIRVLQRPLCERPLPGADVEATPTINVEVDPTGRKNRLFFYISEPNGYYVESFQIRFFHKKKPDDGPEDSKFSWIEIIDKYVEANKTFVGCVDVVPAELRAIGGVMGTTANWGAEIVDWCRARAKNPDPLPPLADAVSCDEPGAAHAKP